MKQASEIKVKLINKANDLCADELIKQVKVQCNERGEVLGRLVESLKTLGKKVESNCTLKIEQAHKKY